MMYSKVMLIDDNDLDQFVNSTLLKKSGFVADTSGFVSAIEALEYLETVEDDFPDLILLDIKMPEMSGFEFLDRFAKIPDSRRAGCCVYMLSSSHDPVDLQKAKESPLVSGYLNKPLNPKIIEDVLCPKADGN